MVNRICPLIVNGMAVTQIQEALSPKTPQQLKFYFDIIDTCTDCKKRCNLKKVSLFAKERTVYIQCTGCLEAQSLLLVNEILAEGRQRFDQVDNVIYHKHKDGNYVCRVYR